MIRKEKALLIVPAYNEGRGILRTCRSLRGFDYIVINDGSDDDTEKILQDNRIPHLTLICNLGIGGAVQTGYKYALENGYDIAIQFDGDGQHNASSIDKMLEEMQSSNADMVIGSRFINRKLDNFMSSAMRRFGVRMISFFIKMRTGQKIYDTTSGFRAVNRRLMAYFATNYSVEYPEPISTTEALLNHFKVIEISAKMNAREEGKSSISTFKSAYYMINVCLQILVTRGRHE